MKICVVVTARPSYSRVKSALQALQGRCDLQVIAAASALTWRHGRIVDVVRADGFQVAAEIPAVVDGGGTRESVVSTGLLAIQIGPALESLKPDCVVTIADRHETLATAIAAAFLHIPLVHVQGGEVSGSIDDKVRNAVTQLADLHLVSTTLAKIRVEAMRPGVEVCVTGCPSLDLALEARHLGPIHKADVIVLQHPVTTEVEKSAQQMRETITAVYGENAAWFWPGEDAGADPMSKELRLEGLHPIRNLKPIEFLRVLLGAKVLVGNSSVGIRECSFLGVPVVNIGTRQAGRERGPNVVDVAPDQRAIRAAIAFQMGSAYPPSLLYGDGQAGPRMAETLMRWLA
jgi:UDP-hydrolysing UDP-N-acetyl-D-glucosamine 2-epimerase